MTGSENEKGAEAGQTQPQAQAEPAPGSPEASEPTATEAQLEASEPAVTEAQAEAASTEPVKLNAPTVEAVEPDAVESNPADAETVEARTVEPSTTEPEADAQPTPRPAMALVAGIRERTRETVARVAELEQAAVSSPVGVKVQQISRAAGSQAKQFGRAGVAAGKRGAVRSAAVSKEVLLPRLWLAIKRIAARLHPKRLALDLQRVLLVPHRLLFDRKFEKLMFRGTAKPARLSTLTVRGRSRAEGHDYRPVPVKVFDWALSAIPEEPSRLRFIDWGAGRGRALLLASLRPFRSVGGVEFAQELQDDAAMNISQFPRPRMRCRDVECVLEDATAIVTPAGPAVHYFFDPFSRVAFAEVLNGISASLRANPRPLYIVLIGMQDGDLVKGNRLFAKRRLPIFTWLKAALFSPYRIEIFESARP